MTDRISAMMGKRTRRARIIFWAIMASGVAGGVALALAAGKGPPLAVDGTISPGAAIGLIAGYLAVFVASWFWYRNADEHERNAYNFGGLLAVHFYFAVVPTWWLGWKGGLLPEIAHLTLLIAVSFVWSVGWLWRRYR